MSASKQENARPVEARGEGAEHRGKRVPTRPSLTFAYTGIRVRDMAESMRFYTDVLGMEIVNPLQSTPPTDGQVVGLKSPRSTQLLELNWYTPGSRFGTPYASGEDLDHLCFECDDVKETVIALEGRGVEVMFRSKEIGAEIGWSEAFVKDPNGIWIELLARKSR